MVIASLYGRMGNNYFQACAAIGYALKHGLEYHIPSSTLKNEVWKPSITHLTNPNYNPNLETITLREQGHEYNDLHFEESWRDKNIILSGYFQSEMYFKNYRTELLEAFDTNALPLKGVCSIHHRYTDYIELTHKHPPINANYLKDAMEYILLNTKVHTFLVFSDDIERAKLIMNKVNLFPSFKVFYSEGNDAHSDFIKMSACEHNIISNSTFSWWSSWLNKNPNKIIVSPDESNWFGEGNSNLSTETLIPKNWIRIKY